MASLEISHDILIKGADFEACRQQVQRFFSRTMLVRYDAVRVVERESVNGCGQDFQARILEGIRANRRVVNEFLENLKSEGFVALDDLQSLEKGYLSKILHTIAHLQDGFIGIDSRFYNLEEDSHGVSRHLQRKINAEPQRYWIIRVTGSIATPGEDPLDAMRTFEGRGVKHD